MSEKLSVIELEQDANYLRTMLVRSKQNIVDVGLKLIEVRSRFTRTKDFRAWIETEVRISHGTADNFMRAALFLQKVPNLATCDSSVIYELSAPATPQEVIMAVQESRLEATLPAIREAKRALKGDTSRQPSTPAEKLFLACVNFMAEYDSQETQVDALLDAFDMAEDFDLVVRVMHDFMDTLEEALAPLDGDD